MSGWGITETAPEIEKIKAESDDYLNGLNSCGEIPWEVYDYAFDFYNELIQKAYELGKAEAEPHWIPVTERLPKEEDSIFARYYGTDRWRKSMFRKKSREVIVTSVFEDGELHTEVAHTTDGEWHVGVNVVPRTVIAWMPLPEPYKGVTE